MNAVQTLPHEYSLPAKPVQSPQGILVVDDDDRGRSIWERSFANRVLLYGWPATARRPWRFMKTTTTKLHLA
jgi:hypothetical protein